MLSRLAYLLVDGNRSTVRHAIMGFWHSHIRIDSALIDRQRLDRIEVRQKLGFLFRGYVLRYYYWEIVIMFRKIAMILIQSFLV